MPNWCLVQFIEICHKIYNKMWQKERKQDKIPIDIIPSIDPDTLFTITAWYRIYSMCFVIRMYRIFRLGENINTNMLKYFPVGTKLPATDLCDIQTIS